MSEEISCVFCSAPAHMLMITDEESIVGVDADGVGWEMYILTFFCCECETEFCIDLDPNKIMELVKSTIGWTRRKSGLPGGVQ